MNQLILLLIVLCCFGISTFADGGTGVFALFLCIVSFVFGARIYAGIVVEKAKKGELLELGKKYYAINYVKDKVE